MWVRETHFDWNTSDTEPAFVNSAYSIKATALYQTGDVVASQDMCFRKSVSFSKFTPPTLPLSSAAKGMKGSTPLQACPPLPLSHSHFQVISQSVFFLCLFRLISRFRLLVDTESCQHKSLSNCANMGQGNR